ncbi:MAG: hypothetical protein FWD00_01010 [Clostridiales bacterium]|nr:hypothetical protein [Clostridiales bacterium]
MKKAIIFSHERGGSVVMANDGTFHFVKGHSLKPIGTEIEMEVKSIPRVNFRRIATVAACFIVAITIGGYAWLLNSINYMVYIDINPSVKMQFNALERLSNVRLLHEDSTNLLDDVALRGNMETASVQLIHAAVQRGYLDPEADAPMAVISVFAASSRCAEERVATIQSMLEEHGLNDIVAVTCIDADLRDRALEIGVSPGRLKIAEELASLLGQDASIEELLQRPIQNLIAATNEAEHMNIASTDEPPAATNEPTTENNEPAGTTQGSQGASGAAPTAPTVTISEPQVPEAEAVNNELSDVSDEPQNETEESPAIGEELFAVGNQPPEEDEIVDDVVDDTATEDNRDANVSGGGNQNSGGPDQGSGSSGPGSQRPGGSGEPTCATHGHIYLFISTAPTCTADGYIKVTCDRCDYVRIEAGEPATGHVYGPPATCTDPQICLVCEYELAPALGHDWTQVRYIKPTFGTDGYWIYQCSRCKETKTVTDYGSELGQNFISIVTTVKSNVPEPCGTLHNITVQLTVHWTNSSGIMFSGSGIVQQYNSGDIIVEHFAVNVSVHGNATGDVTINSVTPLRRN